MTAWAKLAAVALMMASGMRAAWARKMNTRVPCGAAPMTMHRAVRGASGLRMTRRAMSAAPAVPTTHPVTFAVPTMRPAMFAVPTMHRVMSAVPTMRPAMSATATAPTTPDAAFKSGLA
jgi:hypothetical protein